MDRRAFLAGAGATAVAATGGCLGLGASEDYDVGMTLDSFDPETITVTPGTTVVWKNTSSRGHTVTAYEGSLPEEADFFASGEFETEAAAREAWQTDEGGIRYGGETFEHTFEVPGTYAYVCLPHERDGMVGSVEVRPATTTASRDS
jgi:plastocyanin